MHSCLVHSSAFMFSLFVVLYYYFNLATICLESLGEKNKLLFLLSGFSCETLIRSVFPVSSFYPFLVLQIEHTCIKISRHLVCLFFLLAYLASMPFHYITAICKWP